MVRLVVERARFGGGVFFFKGFLLLFLLGFVCVFVLNTNISNANITY